MKRVFFPASLALILVLAGCASAPQSKYYSLSGTAEPAPATAARGDFAISLSSVQIPEQVDRPQIVLSREGDAQVTLLNESQWAAPLADEIRNALSHDLTRRLGVLDVSPRAAPESLPLWTLGVTIQRFESVYGRRALLEATWRQAPRRGTQGAQAICRAEIEVPVQEGMSALVAGHQQALDILAGLMADKLSGRALEAGQGVTLKGCA